jgi:hypothetical protein
MYSKQKSENQAVNLLAQQADFSIGLVLKSKAAL